MQFDELLRMRRSCRLYRRKPLEFDTLGQILQAGLWAPSSGNLQNWEFVVVTDAGKREQLAKACVDQQWMVTAPVHLVVCNDRERVKKMYPRRWELYSIQNSALAAGNILLKAADLGLGSCWIGSFDEIAVKRILRIPSHIEPELIITLGYPAQVDDVGEREPLSVVTHFEVYGAKHREGAVSSFPLGPQLGKRMDDLRDRVVDASEQIKKKNWFSRLFEKKKEKENI